MVPWSVCILNPTPLIPHISSTGSQKLRQETILQHYHVYRYQTELLRCKKRSLTVEYTFSVLADQAIHLGQKHLANQARMFASHRHVLRNSSRPRT
jgi:hypothetical protein